MSQEKDVADVFTAFVDEVRGRLEGLETCVGVLMGHAALAAPERVSDMIGTLESLAEDVRRANGHPQKRKLLSDMARELHRGLPAAPSETPPPSR